MAKEKKYGSNTSQAAREAGGLRKLKRVVIKEELVALTGDCLSAAILNQLIYWTDRVATVDEFVKEELERLKREAERTGQDQTQDAETIQPSHGWVYKDAGELEQELMGLGDETTIRRRLAGLVARGWLWRRRNPRYAWDRRYQYRWDAAKTKADLEALGYSLDGWQVFQALQVVENNQRALCANDQAQGASYIRDYKAKTSPEIINKDGGTAPETTEGCPSGAQESSPTNAGGHGHPSFTTIIEEKGNAGKGRPQGPEQGPQGVSQPAHGGKGGAEDQSMVMPKPAGDEIEGAPAQTIKPGAGGHYRPLEAADLPRCEAAATVQHLVAKVEAALAYHLRLQDNTQSRSYIREARAAIADMIAAHDFGLVWRMIAYRPAWLKANRPAHDQRMIEAKYIRDDFMKFLQTMEAGRPVINADPGWMIATSVEIECWAHEPVPQFGTPPKPTTSPATTATAAPPRPAQQPPAPAPKLATAQAATPRLQQTPAPTPTPAEEEWEVVFAGQ